MEKFVILVVLAGLVAGAFLLGGAGGNSNPQSAYVPEPGDCVVLPQGQDAVYDQFYAQEVNPYNCRSFENQSDAHLTDAQAAYVEVQTDKAFTDNVMSAIGVLFTGTLGAIVLVLIVIGLIKGAA